MEMTVADAMWSQQQNPGQPGVRQTIISFYDREVQNEYESDKEGRPIFTMKTYITKIPPGDKTLVIDRKATKKDFVTYRPQYQAYLQGVEAPLNGTPLAAWAQVTRAQVAEWKALNIFTVDQLAELPDSYGTKIMGFQGWKQKAQAFIAAGKGEGQLNMLQSELKKRDDEIARMKSNEDANASMMRTMQERLAALEGDREPPKVDAGRRATIQR